MTKGFWFWFFEVLKIVYVVSVVLFAIISLTSYLVAHGVEDKQKTTLKNWIHDNVVDNHIVVLICFLLMFVPNWIICAESLAKHHVPFQYLRSIRYFQNKMQNEEPESQKLITNNIAPLIILIGELVLEKSDAKNEKVNLLIDQLSRLKDLTGQQTTLTINTKEWSSQYDRQLVPKEAKIKALFEQVSKLNKRCDDYMNQFSQEQVADVVESRPSQSNNMANVSELEQQVKLLTVENRSLVGDIAELTGKVLDLTSRVEAIDLKRKMKADLDSVQLEPKVTQTKNECLVEENLLKQKELAELHEQITKVNTELDRAKQAQEMTVQRTEDMEIEKKTNTTISETKSAAPVVLSNEPKEMASD